MASFFDKHAKVQAVLTGKYSEPSHDDTYEKGRGRAVLYAKTPIPGATGHKPKTTADGTILHPVAQIRPVAGGGYRVSAGLAAGAGVGGMAGVGFSHTAADTGMGLYLAGPNGTFYEAPRDSAGFYLHELPVPKGQEPEERPKPGPPPELLLAKQGEQDLVPRWLVRTANGETVALTDYRGFTTTGHVIGVASNVDVVHVLSLQIVQELQVSAEAIWSHAQNKAALGMG